MKDGMIRACTMDHAARYGEIYAAAFSGEPWNDPWKPEDAEIHVRELLESRQSYGLEYLVDGLVVGFILGTSENTMYGTLGPERVVWDEDAYEAMQQSIRKNQKNQGKKNRK